MFSFLRNYFLGHLRDMLRLVFQLAITCSELTMETLKQVLNNKCQWCRSSAFIVSFEDISHLVLVFPLLL